MIDYPTADVDSPFLLLCTLVVFMMQVGFLCLETGLTRSKNSINVALKNVVDFCIASAMFGLLGCQIAFLDGDVGWALRRAIEFDLGVFLETPGSSQWMVFLIFQTLFCCTSVTIISGAVAERLRFKAYLAIAVVVSLVIYPVAARLAWHGMNDGVLGGPLGSRGFVDFAGATVVHSTGAWVALAGLLIIGARKGRFAEDGTPRPIHGSNIPLAMVGMFILWFSWFGFNAGSNLRFDSSVILIFVNTIFAGATGVLATLAISLTSKRIVSPEEVLRGVLAGLVSITAVCHAVAPLVAGLIGMGGALAAHACDRLLIRMRIDDAVGVVPVHLAAGVWGTLAVGIFGNLEILGTGLDRFEQVSIQIGGIVTSGAWAFGSAYLLLRALNAVMPLRVTAEQEWLGLNVSEHGAKTELYDVVAALTAQRESRDLSLRAPVEPFTEVGVIAAEYNAVLESLEENEEALKQSNARLTDKNRALDSFAGTVAHDLKGPLSTASGFAELISTEVTGELKEYADTVVRIHGKMNRLIRSFLSYARSGSEDVRCSTVDLEEVVESTLAQLHSQIAASSAELSCALEAEQVEADSDLLIQTLMNLVGNALKYCEPGRAPQIWISSRIIESGEVEILVQDAGLGIREDKLADVFKEFVRVHDPNFKVEGTGIGLATVKRIVEAMGGEVSVESRLGEGSTFRLLFRAPGKLDQP